MVDAVVRYMAHQLALLYVIPCLLSALFFYLFPLNCILQKILIIRFIATLVFIKQCLVQAGGSLAQLKTRVEERFDHIKTFVSKASDHYQQQLDEAHPHPTEPRLVVDDQQWLRSLVTEILEMCAKDVRGETGDVRVLAFRDVLLNGSS